MPHFYQKHLSKTLSDALDAMLDKPPAEQLELFAELGMMRDMLHQVYIMYGQLREKKLKYHEMSDAEKKKFDADELYMMDLNKELIGHVRVMSTSAAAIYNTAKDKVPVQTLKFFTDQITRCAHEAAKFAFEGDAERAKVFAEKFNTLVKTEIRLPEFDNKGQMVTNLPSDDINEMIASVPKVTE